MSASYLCEVEHGVCYQESIGNDLFVSFIINKGRVAWHLMYAPEMLHDTLSSRAYCNLR